MVVQGCWQIEWNFYTIILEIHATLFERWGVNTEHVFFAGFFSAATAAACICTFSTPEQTTKIGSFRSGFSEGEK